MSTSTGQRTRDLRALPKAHLHLHLEGAMRRSMLDELARERGVELPPFGGDRSFAAFLAMGRAAGRIFQGPDDLVRLVQEVAEDAAAAGAVWVEPSEYMSARWVRQLGLDAFESVLEVLLHGCRQAEQRVRIGVGLMIAVDRGRPPEEAMELAALAARYAGRGVVSFGLHGDETAAPAEPFAAAFALARAVGLLSAPHAGEIAGPESVRSALDVLGARRIQHGIRAVEDASLVERLVADQVCLDVCPTSNVWLSVVPSLEQHPLPQLLAAGVPLSVNSDDPLFFESDLLQE